jgi:hypothetical protein
MDKEENNGTQSSYREMTLHSISVGVLCDTFIYDQKVSIIVILLFQEKIAMYVGNIESTI